MQWTGHCIPSPLSMVCRLFKWGDPPNPPTPAQGVNIVSLNGGGPAKQCNLLNEKSNEAHQRHSTPQGNGWP